MTYSLYPDCVPVEGISRCAIYDLGRREISFIPIGLYEILTSHETFSLEKLKQLYPDEQDTIQEYMDFLIEKEYLYEKSEGITLKKPEISFETPGLVNNIILDVDEASEHPYPKIVSSINETGGKSLLIRFFYFIELEKLSQICEYFAMSRLKDIVIILPDSSYGNSIYQLIDQYKQISEIIFYQAKQKRENTYKSVVIKEIPYIINHEDYCGTIRLEHFRVNMQLYMESKLYNNCLYKKVSIDKRGNIKNCPAMKKSYGNIKNCSLSDILKTNEFQLLWHIRKDEIQKCKKCEFRYMCTDCRAFTKNTNDLFSPPAKCTYDPQTNEWFNQ